MNTIKAFFKGFDYSVKMYEKIEDYHFQSLPGANWYDQKTQKNYRKGIFVGRKYMQYRYEILLTALMTFTLVLWFYGW